MTKYLHYLWFVCICLTYAIGWSQTYYTEKEQGVSFELDYYQGQLWHINEDFQLIAKHLKEYYKQNGQYPDNNEGLSVLTKLKDILILKNSYLPPPIGTSESTYRFSRSGPAEMVSFDYGILSPWLIPYSYENRRGLEPALFEDSPVNKDNEQHYSLKVDEGIYVYFVNGIAFHQKYKHYLQEKERGKIRRERATKTTIILITLFTFLFIWGFIRAKKLRAISPLQPLWFRITKWIGGVILILGSLGFGGSGVWMTCYIMDFSSLHDRPKMKEQYKALLMKYYQKGIITQETYDKVNQALARVDKLIEKE